MFGITYTKRLRTYEFSHKKIIVGVFREPNHIKIEMCLITNLLKYQTTIVENIF